MTAELPLRERKKVLTRAAIVRAAQALFEERGFDNVTVAEIADAANVSVKTLFVYFRSKDELAFADTALFDDLLAAIANRPAGTGAARATVTALLDAAGGGTDVADALEGFHRGYGTSPSLQAGLLRLWADLEERVTAALAAEAHTDPTPAQRLFAMQLVAIVRTVVSPEVRTLVANRAPDERIDALRDWLHTAARTVSAPTRT